MKPSWQLICAASLLALAAGARVNAQLVEGMLEGLGRWLIGSGSTPTPAAGKSKEVVAARCVLERRAEFRTPPRLFFYTRKLHAANSLGCRGKKAKKITLRKMRAQNESEAKLDDNNIRRRLLDNSLFEPKLSTYFIVHGFMSSWNSSDWMCDVKDLLLNSSRANVFIVDWSGGSKPQVSIDYGMAVSNTPVAGQLLGEFIERLVALSGQPDAESYHLIGHSLGAHICGFAGYYVQSVGKITALDPAGPCFRGQDWDEMRRARDTGHMKHGRRRLSRQSARRVVAIHTDANLFGLPEECAHFDIFINGGQQPFCKAASIAEAIGGALLPSAKMQPGPTCPHSFAYELLLRSFVRLVKKAGDLLRGKKEQWTGDEKKKKKKPMLASLQEAQSDKRELGRDDQADQCHLMGYHCASYQAFERGQCGFCKDDASCLFVGLNFEEGDEQDEASKIARQLDKTEVADDNDYDEEPRKVEGSRGGELHSGQAAPRASPGELFVKTGGLSDVCLFHYQLLVAFDSKKLSAVPHEQSHVLALHLPLEDPNKGLVEAMHRLDEKDDASGRLRDLFVHSLWEAGAREALRSRDELTFNTALITFGVAPADKCAETKNASSIGDRLCRPFDRLDGARLWSTDAKKLESVRWLALNYMSGLDERARRSRSFLLEPAPGKLKVLRREQINRRLGLRAEGASSRLGFGLELVSRSQRSGPESEEENREEKGQEEEEEEEEEDDEGESPI